MKLVDSDQCRASWRRVSVLCGVHVHHNRVVIVQAATVPLRLGCEVGRKKRREKGEKNFCSCIFDSV